MSALESSLNIFYGIDIIVNFLSAYHDDDFQIVDDFKVCAPIRKLNLLLLRRKSGKIT